jgi:hypothetical protein
VFTHGVDRVDNDTGGFVTSCGAGERFECREEGHFAVLQFLRRIEVEQIERRHKRSTLFYTVKIQHPIFGSQLCDLIGGIP